MLYRDGHEPELDEPDPPSMKVDYRTITGLLKLRRSGTKFANEFAYTMPGLAPQTMGMVWIIEITVAW